MSRKLLLLSNSKNYDGTFLGHVSDKLKQFLAGLVKQLVAAAEFECRGIVVVYYVQSADCGIHSLRTQG